VQRAVACVQYKISITVVQRFIVVVRIQFDKKHQTIINIKINDYNYNLDQFLTLHLNTSFPMFRVFGRLFLRSHSHPISLSNSRSVGRPEVSAIMLIKSESGQDARDTGR